MKGASYFDNKKSLYIITAGYILFIISLIAAILSNPIFIAVMAISIKLFTNKGAAITNNLKSYKTYYNIFGLRIGVWKDLPKPEYLSILASKATIVLRGNRAPTQVAFQDEFYKIHLFHNENEYLEIYRGKNKEKAYAFAKELAKGLNTDLYDAINDVWI